MIPAVQAMIQAQAQRFDLVYASNQADVDIGADLLAAFPWIDLADVRAYRITIEPGVLIGASAAGIPAMRTGDALPSHCSGEIYNAGLIEGAGGAGGLGGRREGTPSGGFYWFWGGGGGGGAGIIGGPGGAVRDFGSDFGLEGPTWPPDPGAPGTFDTGGAGGVGEEALWVESEGERSSVSGDVGSDALEVSHKMKLHNANGLIWGGGGGGGGGWLDGGTIPVDGGDGGNPGEAGNNGGGGALGGAAGNAIREVDAGVGALTIVDGAADPNIKGPVGP